MNGIEGLKSIPSILQFAILKPNKWNILEAYIQRNNNI